MNTAGQNDKEAEYVEEIGDFGYLIGPKAINAKHRQDLTVHLPEQWHGLFLFLSHGHDVQLRVLTTQITTLHQVGSGSDIQHEKDFFLPPHDILCRWLHPGPATSQWQTGRGHDHAYG